MPAPSKPATQGFLHQTESTMAVNPTDADPTTPSNRDKNPDEWATGDETMMGAQAPYLKILCQEAGEEFDPEFSKAEASKRIEELQVKTGRGRDH
jgi:hypothetical protein